MLEFEETDWAPETTRVRVRSEEQKRYDAAVANSMQRRCR